MGENSGVERMFDFFHFGHEIGGFDESVGRVSAGDDDVQIRLFFADVV